MTLDTRTFSTHRRLLQAEPSLQASNSRRMGTGTRDTERAPQIPARL